VERREAGAEARTAVRAGTVGEAGEAAHAASRDRGMLVGWLAALLVGVAAFHALGDGALALPPVTDPGSWGTWASTREPLVATVALLRLLVLALAWYLVGVTTIGIVARLARAARLVRVADALTVPMVRRLLQGALGLGLATAMVGAATPAAVPAPTAPAVASQHDGDEVRLARADVAGDVAGDADRIRLTVVAPGDEVRLTRADGAGPEAAPDPEVGAEDAIRLTRADADLGAAPLPLGLLGATADRGDADHASDEVVMRRVADATTPAVTRSPRANHGYWQRLVDHNRDVLDDPDNPDLLFPGQVLELPPLDGDAGIVVSGWIPPARDPFVDLADDAAHEAAVRARSEQRIGRSSPRRSPPGSARCATSPSASWS
jgi:hypothetical protein